MWRSVAQPPTDTPSLRLSAPGLVAKMGVSYKWSYVKLATFPQVSGLSSPAAGLRSSESYPP